MGGRRTQHGKPGGSAPGLVAKPYAVKDLRDHLASLTGNRKFADDFFDKYVEGRDAPEYARLLALAGYSLQTAPAGRGWLGNTPVTETPNGLVVGVGGPNQGGPPRPSPVPFNTPLYEAGIDSGDTIKTIDGQPATSSAWAAIANKQPGDQVTLGVMRRGGEMIRRTITLKQDPTARQVVSMENLSAAQKAFRDIIAGLRRGSSKATADFTDRNVTWSRSRHLGDVNPSVLHASVTSLVCRYYVHWPPRTGDPMAPMESLTAPGMVAEFGQRLPL